MKNLILSSLILVLGLSGSALAQSKAVVEPRAAEATRALQDLPQLVNTQNHRQIGFESVDEARSGKLGEPMSVFMIRLDDLRRYRGEEPGRLLVDTQRFVYPVEVAGQARTTVEVRAVDGRWETARIGGAQKARALDKSRKSVMRVSGALSSDFFEVRIPALSLFFLGHQNAEGLQLTPLADDASLGLRAGEAQSASKLLARLVPVALATPDDLP